MLQRAFGPELTLGQWLYFEDANGPGHAQPDAFLTEPERVLLFEVKLTQNVWAWGQLEGLYGPLLTELFGLPVTKVLLCKNLVSDPGPSLVYDANALSGPGPFVWHWRGGASL